MHHQLYINIMKDKLKKYINGIQKIPGELSDEFLNF